MFINITDDLLMVPKHKVYTAEASTLLWDPGVWPKSLVFNGLTFTRGVQVIGRDNDVLYVTYRANNNDLIQVWND